MTLRPHVYHPLQTDQGTFIVNRMDFNRTQDGVVFGVGVQLFSQGAFDPDEIELALRLIDLRRQLHTKEIIALDCGANIGIHSVNWARRIYPEGQVLAIEAQERVFYALAGNILLNNVHNARAIWAAVGETPGQVVIQIPDYLKAGSFGSFSLQPGKSFDVGEAFEGSASRAAVAVVRIDDFGLPRADFIKLDVEGMEIQALRGAQTTIDAWRPILFVEHIKSDRAELSAFLEEHGYRVIVTPMNLVCVHKDDPVQAQVFATPNQPATEGVPKTELTKGSSFLEPQVTKRSTTHAVPA